MSLLRPQYERFPIVGGRVDMEEFQKKVKKFRDARDWAQYRNPKDLAISLSLEAA
jgi:hypothetical protein